MNLEVDDFLSDRHLERLGGTATRKSCTSQDTQHNGFMIRLLDCVQKLMVEPDLISSYRAKPNDQLFDLTHPIQTLGWR
jgi:hypothetical protein